MFWKEVNEVKEGKVDSCSRMKDGKRRIPLEDDKI